MIFKFRKYLNLFCNLLFWIKNFEYLGKKRLKYFLKFVLEDVILFVIKLVLYNLKR